MSSPSIYAVIMAGGAGTRFWPASTAARPKQFLPISGGLPMIVETFRRLEGLVPADKVLVVTTKSQVALVERALPELPLANILAEPEARNTAPCVAWAAFEVARRDPSAVQVILPADHVIRPAEDFRETLLAAAVVAAEEGPAGGLYTFGIEPSFPAEGYGYIKVAERRGESRGQAIFSVERFVEKPDRARAEAFLAEGGFFWNAGIFVWHTGAILRAFETLTPALAASMHTIMAASQTPEAQAVLEAEYKQLAKDPVDVAIMEQAPDVRLSAFRQTWNDVGSWKALEEISAKDADGNAAVLSPEGELVAIDAKHNLVFAEGERVIALVGVEGLAVVQTKHATLVCPLERAQEVKRVVEELEARGGRFL